MAKKSFDWNKYGRVAGFLLVAVLFTPILVIFLVKSNEAVMVKRIPAVRTMVEQITPSSDAPCGMRGCRENKGWLSESGMAATPTPMPVMQTKPMMVGDMSTTMMDRQVAKSASLELRAASLSWTSNEIQSMVKRVGGFVESANVSQPLQGLRTAWMTVRVPADRLDVTVEEAKRAASAVVSENMNAGDVTDQVIDLTARLTAKRAEEAALVSLLDKATKVSDVIEVTERLSMVRSEIEQMTAEQRRLEGQVAMASLSISITEDPQIVVDTNSVRDGNVVKQSVTDLVRWGIAFGSALVSLLIGGLPVVILYGFVLWVAYRFARLMARRIMK